MSMKPQELWDMLLAGKAADVLDIPRVAEDALGQWNRCRALIELRRYTEAVNEGREAWLFIDQLRPEDQAVVCLDYSHALGFVGDYLTAIAVARTGTQMAIDDHTVRLRVRENLGYWLGKAGHSVEALVWLHAAADIAKGEGLVKEHARLTYLIGRCLLMAGEIDEAGRYLELARPILEEFNSRQAGLAQVYYGLYSLAVGEWDSAERWARHVIQRYSQDRPDVAALGWYLLAEVATVRGMDVKVQELRYTAQNIALQLGRDDLIREGHQFQFIVAARR